LLFLPIPFFWRQGVLTFPTMHGSMAWHFYLLFFFHPFPGWYFMNFTMGGVRWTEGLHGILYLSGVFLDLLGVVVKFSRGFLYLPSSKQAKNGSDACFLGALVFSLPIVSLSRSHSFNYSLIFFKDAGGKGQTLDWLVLLWELA
jgi:hypothetical protein